MENNDQTLTAKLIKEVVSKLQTDKSKTEDKPTVKFFKNRRTFIILLSDRGLPVLAFASRKTLLILPPLPMAAMEEYGAV